MAARTFRLTQQDDRKGLSRLLPGPAGKVIVAGEGGVRTLPIDSEVPDGRRTTSTADSKAAQTLEKLIFGHRLVIVVVFALLTAVLATIAARGLHIDASFTKQLPLKHEYMQTFVKHQSEFGSANRVLIALVARDGNMFQAGFFDALKKATDEVLVMDGIDRTRVQSLFTPNVRYMEVVEGGIEAGNVVDAEFLPTPEALEKVRENILKAGIRGRLVANDFSGALISAVVLEQDATGRPIDPIAVAHALETARARQDPERRGAGAGAGVGRRRAHDRLRQGGRRHRRRRDVRGGVRHRHHPADAARGLVLRAVVQGGGGAHRLLHHRGDLAARARWCCSASASIRSGCSCPS
jgi:hypothetical protein